MNIPIKPGTALRSGIRRPPREIEVFVPLSQLLSPQFATNLAAVFRAQSEAWRIFGAPLDRT